MNWKDLIHRSDLYHHLAEGQGHQLAVGQGRQLTEEVDETDIPVPKSPRKEEDLGHHQGR